MLLVNRVRRSLAVVAAAAVLTVTAPACTGGGGERITVYSGRSSELIKPLLDRFAEQTGISVDFKTGDSAELALLIEQEGDRSPADVFLSQSPGAMGYLEGLGRLRPLPVDILERVAPENHGSNGTWVGMSGRLRVLVYNTDLVDEATLPASVFDLTRPEYAGKVAVAPQNGSFQDFITAMRLQLGDDVARSWLEGMAANDAPTYANNVAIVAAVGRGEVPYGLANHYYNVRAKAEDPSVPSANHIFPNGDVGSLLMLASAGVLRSARNPGAAEELVRFLLSEEAQRYFAEQTYEYPLAAGVQPAGDLPPLSSLDVDRVDFDDLGGGLARTLELIEASGLGD